MKQTILDSSFILTCTKQKIDLFKEIPLMGFQIIIPLQVIGEIKKQTSLNSDLALRILKKSEFKQIDLGKGHVDRLLINYAKQNKNVVIATLDKEIKEKVKNPKLIIRRRKNLEII